MLLPLLLFAQAPGPTPGHPIVVKTEYIGDRFTVLPVTTSGMKLRLFADSAGNCILATEDAEQLKLPISKEGDRSMAPFPSFRADSLIPAAVTNKVMLFPKAANEQELGKGYDGMLGQQWFGAGVWTLDYPGKQLLWRAPGDLPKHDPSHEVKLFFRTDPNGTRVNNFARLPVQIDGENLSFTLDTGATDYLTPEALKIVNDGGPSERATSFLAQSVYDRWHAKHPDWRVVTTHTGTGNEMIEAPKVTIGGYEVGPVWFSVQPDRAFHQFMARYTDQPTDGSMGGSAFKYLRMTIDWPNAVAVFERP